MLIEFFIKFNYKSKLALLHFTFIYKDVPFNFPWISEIPV